ncbi:MAG: DUF1949 domain-containing protein, partial [Clostridia bacterium]|nr:DUF1949 domain-containing protein [Clostridia bacterium]
AADGVTAVGTARMEPGVRLLLKCGYPIYDRVQRMPALQKAEILNTEFGAEIEMELMLRAAEEEGLRQALADLSAGTAVLERLEEIFYPFKTIC